MKYLALLILAILLGAATTPYRDYQIEVYNDTLYIYDGYDLKGKVHIDSSINQVLINDNL